MSPKNRKVEEKTDREWLLLRPQNIIGAIQEVKQEGYILADGKYAWKEYYMVPAFFKIVNEIIDNSVDVFIKSEGKSANKIDVKMTDTMVSVKDNGFGIPVEKTDSGAYMPEVAWGRPRAGSNFHDEDNQGQLGMNGIGSYATAVFSKKFKGTTSDGKNKMVVEFSNNLEKTKITGPTSSRLKGTTVEFIPDLERFGMTKIKEIYKDLIKQRLINIAFSYPGLNFTFNGKAIKVNAKEYIKMFHENATMWNGDNYTVALFPNDTDDFKFFAYTNGLANTKAGSNITYFLDRVTIPLVDRLKKKYPSIKHGDIKNKVSMVVFFRGFKAPKFDGQSKEQFTSPQSKITEFLGKIDYSLWVNAVARNKAITEPIVEVYRIKQEFERRKELKSLEKPKKKITSEKYTPSIGSRKYLMVCEGASASGGLIPTLGREGIGYYELKGVPLNAYTATQQKFTDNPELSMLYQIIKNEGYEYVIYATDQDLDGFKIRGLLTGFFYRYLPDYLSKGKCGILNTPIMASRGKGTLLDWVYKLNEKDKLSGAKDIKYYKGLGSWTIPELKAVIKKDGLSKMIDLFEMDEEAPESVDAWLNSKRPDDRKEFLRNNHFDIVKL